MAITPLHLNATAADFEGNDGRGRFLLLPGSRSRAASMASRLESVVRREHPRGHDLHLGVYRHRSGLALDVGVISTGMGCPSVDLIVSELLALGAKVMLRVGTSGSVQPSVSTGDLVVVTAAVRDESTSERYLPREFPALASFTMLRAQSKAAEQLELRGQVCFGPVHTKDSLYAREMHWGPLASEHERYHRLLTQAGVLASEMECAHLFVLAQLGARARALQPAVAGAILAVIGDHDQPFRESPRAAEAVEDAIELAFETFAQLRR